MKSTSSYYIDPCRANIVPIWQIGDAVDGSPFIAMPHLQGGMLHDRLKRERA